jgi:LmbE family N-acetylglucosaminyl deacetylase
MFKPQIIPSTNKPLRVLCLGAHSDDIEIGCGGTILRLSESMPIECTWVVFSAGEIREKEARKSANLFLDKASSKNIIINDFRNGFFPYTAIEIKEYFENLKGSFQPDLIFTHYGKDLHQDHRLISELTWNTFRNHCILEFEIPKYDGDFGAPNIFFELDEQTARRKANYILESFPSQKDKHWFTADTFHSVLRLRGVESAAAFAEAFYCRKMLL